MADPTASEVLAQANTNGGRMSLALAEAKRLLSAVLPGTVTLANTRESTSLPVPEASQFYYAGESLIDAVFPAIAIGSRVSFEPLAGMAQRRIVMLDVFLIMPRLEIGEQIITLWDLGELVQMVMATAQDRHCLPDPDGRAVWSQLIPMEMDTYSASNEQREYSGVRVSFELGQAGLMLWPQS